MSTERDELTKVIAEADGSGHFLRNGRQFAYGPVADAVLAAGYRRHRTITTEEELERLPQGTKLYSPGTTHSWVLNDLSSHGGVRVHGTGGGYTYIRDFMLHEAPLVLLHEGNAA